MRCETVFGLFPVWTQTQAPTYCVGPVHEILVPSALGCNDKLEKKLMFNKASTEVNVVNNFNCKKYNK